MITTAIVGGDSMTFHAIADDGLGLAPLRRLQQRGPMQHGSTDVGFRLDPRVFSLLIALSGSSITELYHRREELLSFLVPTTELALRFELDDGTRRQIDCRLIDAPMGYDARNVRTAQTVGLRFLASDPTFYDPTSRYINMAEGGVTGWTVPTTVPLTVAAASLDTIFSLTYNGNWRSLPWRIRIRGPITDPVLHNHTTEEKLDFDGTALANVNEWLDIDCRYGRKSVIDQDGENRIAALTADSDLATWHIAPHPNAPGGVNDLQAEGDDITSDTAVVINYFERYLGI